MPREQDISAVPISARRRLAEATGNALADSCGVARRQAGTPQDLQKQWIGHSSLRTGDRYSHTLEEVEYRRTAVGNVGLDRVLSPKQSQHEPPTCLSGLVLNNCLKGKFWLRGLATSIICSFGVPRHDVSPAGLNHSVSSLYNVARTQTELDPIAKRNVQDGGSSLLSIGLHRAVSSPSTPSSTSPCWRGCAANVRGTTKPKNASAQSG
jgi:hypothetical protein